MRVLLINNVGSHQTPLLKGVCTHVGKYGIDVDLFNFNLGFFYSPKGRNVGKGLYIYMCLLKLWHWGIISDRVLFSFLFPYFLKRVVLPYDIVDVQGLFSKSYMKTIPMLKRMNKKIKITIWGSDFYRQLEGTWKEKEICFENCDIISIATSQMKQDFLRVYPQYESKIRLALFGLDQLEVLKDMVLNASYYNHNYLDIPNGKVVVTCGYNRMESQQHLKIIDAISNLPSGKKSDLFLLFPMTYGGSLEYMKSVGEALKKIGIPHKILNERLSLEELLILRIKTNIVVNIQTSDVLAASLQEHLMARNLLVAGDWLPYSIYDDNKIYYKKTTIESLTEDIKWALDNYKLLSEKLAENTQKIYQLSSWNSVSAKWADIYNELV